MQAASATKGVRIEAALGWLVPFALVFYLGMRGGGYDPVVSLPAGIIAWLLLGAGIVFGVLPRSRLRRPELWAAGLLALFALWTALSALWWTSSDERSVASLVLVLTYLGIFAVALTGIGPDAWKRVLGGVGAAIALLAGFALLSRYQPSWLPSDNIAEFLPDVEGRLSYPLDSWNSLGALVAIGLPLVLVVATDAKRVAIQALASAAVPVMALTLFYTLSRSGVGAAALAVVVFIGFHHERLRMLPTLLLTGLGSGFALLLAAGRNELQDTPGSELALQQGDEMLWLTLAICGGVALARAGLARAEREHRVPLPEISPATGRRVWIGAAVVGVLAVVVLAASGEVTQRWDEFTSSSDPTAGEERLSSASGNGRWQQWGAAVDAMESAPITGIGAGTFEYWWARNGTIFGYTRYAHSLYLETLGELGIVGLLVLVGWLALIGALAARRTLEHFDEQRALLGAALAGLAAFAVAMAADWAWQVPAVVVAFLLVAAAAIRSGAAAETAISETAAHPPRAGIPVRVAITAGSLAVACLLATNLAGNVLLDRSQDEAAEDNLDAALSFAEEAERFQPYATSPHLQQALVLQLLDRLDEAAAEATIAFEREPTNWEPLYVYATIQKDLRHPLAARTAYVNARSLNPRSPIFLENPDAVLPP